MYKIFIFSGAITFSAYFLLFLSPAIQQKKSIGFIIWEVTRLEQLATGIDSKNPNLTFTIAEYYFNQGNYNVEKAEKYFTRTIELDSQHKESYYQRGRIRFLNGQFAIALNDMRKVLSLDPEFSKAYYMYGLISGYVNNMKEAEYGFSEFIKRDSFNWAGYNDLAWVYFKQGNYEKTEETAKKGLEQAPNNPWLLNMYGTALMNRGEKETARAIFEQALQESERLTPADWGRSYPGNNPQIYAHGLEETRSVIKHNLSLVTKSQ